MATRSSRAGFALRCLDYEDGQRFCGRPCGDDCPQGFTCDGEQCRRPAGCTRNSLICPAADGPQEDCRGTGQICEGTPCPNAAGAICVTNNAPGVLGLCLGTCTADTDCPADRPLCNPRNGICTLPCDKGSCSPDQTCHSDGLCWPACTDDEQCIARDGNTYCNRPDRAWPTLFKEYRDVGSCAPLGCERAVDCPDLATTCDRTATTPVCTPGCRRSSDCVSGQACKTPPEGSYDPAQCTSFPDHDEAIGVGICCQVGCSDRQFQCGINEFCCGEPDSPFASAADCPPTMSAPTEAGECFDMPVDPFCQPCTPGTAGCSAAWSFGKNVDPAYNNGLPFDEQSFCFSVGAGVGVCSVGYRPSAPDFGAPRGWSCGPYVVPCFSAVDCDGLECVGASTGRAGACRCGEGDGEDQPCSSSARLLPESVLRPRCRTVPNPPVGAAEDDRFCIAAYTCQPPSNAPETYPATCGL